MSLRILSNSSPKALKWGKLKHRKEIKRMERKLMKLRGRIIEMYGTYSRFAERIGLTKAALSIALKRGEFSSIRIREWADALQIPDSEISDYFLP